VNGGVPLGRILGIEIRAHWTWVFVLALITVLLGMGLSSPLQPGWSYGFAWATAIVCAALVFVSVVAHEVAHVVAARRAGVGAPVVVVQLLGGTYVMEVQPRSPGEEFRLAASGPAVSALLVAVLGATTLALESVMDIGSAPVGFQAAEFVVLTACLFNLFLMIVNLIPGYPLDGGRIVHAMAWRLSGNERSANATVSRVGRWTGSVLMVVGALLIPLWDVWPGLGLLVSGWLLVGSSRVLDRRGQLQNMVAGLRASDAVEPQLARVPAQLTIDVLISEYLGDRPGGAALVERDREVVGLVGAAQTRRVPQRMWTTARTEEAMVPLAGVPKVSPDAELWTAFEMLERSGLDALLLDRDEGEPQVITRRSAAKLIHERAMAEDQSDASLRGGRGSGDRRGPGRGGSRGKAVRRTPNRGPDEDKPDEAKPDDDTASAGDDD
jgi:Zn-dependent protease